MPQFQINSGDSLAFLRSLPEGSIDLISTDPPYESLEKHRKVGTTTRLKHSDASSNEWFSVIKNEAFVDYFREFMRLLKKGRHLYLFCDPETSYAVYPMAMAAGFLWGNRIIWDKEAMGMGYHYRRSYEDILFFVRPGGEKRRLKDLGVRDVIKCKRLKGPDFYPTEKPVGVNSVLIGQSAMPGEFVLDPFCGSGSTGEAALTQGCNFVGSDLSPAAVSRTRARLSSFGKEGAVIEASVPRTPKPIFG